MLIRLEKAQCAIYIYKHPYIINIHIDIYIHVSIYRVYTLLCIIYIYVYIKYMDIHIYICIYIQKKHVYNYKLCMEVCCPT